MELALAAVTMGIAATTADAAPTFDPDFYTFLKQQGLEEPAFTYALVWAGSSDPNAEAAVAFALLDGVGVKANPKAAIALACRSQNMAEFDVSRILIQANLRLAKKDFKPIRCADK